MKAGSTAVVYFPQRDLHSPDASHSRVYLTRWNNRSGQPLPGRQKDPITHPAAAKSGTNRASVIEMAALTEEEIVAMPASSSEDEGDGDGELSIDQVEIGDVGVSHSPAGTKRKFQGDRLMTRKKTKSSRASSRILKAEEQLNQTSFAVPSSDPLDWMNSSQNSRLQSSQGKRRANYGKTNTGTSTGKENVMREKKAGVEIPDDLLDEPEEKLSRTRKSKSSSFAAVAELPPTPRKKRDRTKAAVKDVPPDPEPESRSISFCVPEDDLGLEPSSSNNSLTTNTTAVFDVEGLPQSLHALRRHRASSRSSTSSLSDVDSIVSVEMTHEQKERLKAGIILASSSVSIAKLLPDHVRCPICARAVHRDRVGAYTDQRNTSVNTRLRTGTNGTRSTGRSTTDPSKLSQQQQQDFCYRHQIDDAQREWTLKGYPRDINWTELEKIRIPKHMTDLQAVLLRKKPSYYRQLLEDKIQTSKGHKTKTVKRYLTEEMVDIAKPGYYGPRGAKIMGHAIAEQLAKPLKLSLRSDQTIMDVGVSGFISAVLLPELTLRLVMEDILSSSSSSSMRPTPSTNNLASVVDNDNDRDAQEDHARKILDESTAVGVLLCPDDDHVEREDDVL